MNAARRGLNPQPKTAALRSAGVRACGFSGRPARSFKNITLSMALAEIQALKQNVDELKIMVQLIAEEK